MKLKTTREGWTIWHAVAALAMVAIGVFITRMAWADMMRIAWVDEESSHVLLVPFAVAWLIWVRRGRMRRCRPGPTMVAPLMIGVGWALWTWGYRAPHESAWHGGAILLTAGCLIAALGPDVLFKFLPAFLVLIFLIPMPATPRHYVAQPLQTITARATEGVLELFFGINVNRSGNLLQINGHDVAVAEACNGMRMVFTLFLVCYLFAFTTPLRQYVRIIILALSPLTAVVCNVIRLVPTVWVYGFMSADTAKTFHDVTAWVMLVAAFLLLTGIVRVLRWAMLPVMTFTLAGT